MFIISLRVILSLFVFFLGIKTSEAMESPAKRKRTELTESCDGSVKALIVTPHNLRDFVSQDSPLNLLQPFQLDKVTVELIPSEDPLVVSRLTLHRMIAPAPIGDNKIEATLHLLNEPAIHLFFPLNIDGELEGGWKQEELKTLWDSINPFPTQHPHLIRDKLSHSLNEFFYRISFMHPIPEDLSSSPFLKNLTLSDIDDEKESEMGKSGHISTACHIITSYPIESLKIKGSILLSAEALALSQAIVTQSRITSLTMEASDFHPDFIPSLIQGLNDSALVSLAVIYVTMDPQYIQAISQALKNNQTLKYLALESCCMDNDDAKAIAEALQENRTLTSLSVAYNEIGDEGAFALAGSIKSHPSLNALNLHVNELTYEGMQAILKIVQSKNTDFTLEIDNSHHSLEVDSIYPSFTPSDLVEDTTNYTVSTEY